MPNDRQSHREIPFRQTLAMAQAAKNQIRALRGCGLGISTQTTRFLEPFWISLNSFLRVEAEKGLYAPLWEVAKEYQDLLYFNWGLANKGLLGSGLYMSRFYLGELNRLGSAWLDAISSGSWEKLSDFSAREATILDLVLHEYPKAIHEVKSEFGFHPETGGYPKAAETDRFELYQVLPSDPNVGVDPKGKPVLIVPPYVLGANILCFLPREKKSYVHAFANQGIPTYIRIVKDINVCEAVQRMSGEDDALDTRYFCEVIRERHNRAVTLNGFCQGGFLSVMALLSGELDGLVDAFITCVAPMDGSRSVALVEYLQSLPPRFRDMGYAVKTLPNGNRVVDGKVMGLVYKLMSMDEEAPLAAFFKELTMFQSQEGAGPKIQKTAAAINHWMIYDRSDLPEAITKLSYDSYTIPVAPDGTLPVRLFGRTLNFRRIEEKGIQWLICVAESDALVDPASALAPLDWVKAEVAVFPKGHTSIATSWSSPASKCALHTRFGRYRGPVRFQIDLQDGTVGP